MKMDLVRKLGGRKFILALLLGATGVAIELTTGKGLSPTVAGFLLSIAGMFNTANHLATKAYLQSQSEGQTGDDSTSSSNGSLHEKLDELKQIASASQDPATAQQLVQPMIDLLQGIKQGVDEVKKTTVIVGQAVSNTNEIIKRASKQ